MKRQVIIYLTLVIFFLGTYIFQASKGEGNVSSKSLKIGYFPNLTHAPALIAKNHKLIEKELGEDVKVEWKQFNDGPAAMEAIFAGEIDFSYIGPGPAISAYMKSGGDVAVVSGVTEGGAILISGKDSDISSLSDLVGKKVSVPKTGSTQEVAFRGMMDSENMEGIDIVQGKNADVESLLDRKDIDAAFIVEPWGSLIEEKGDAKIIVDNDKTYKGGKYPTTVLIGRKEYIEKNRSISEKFLAAEFETVERINRDREWAVNTLIEEMEILTKKKLSDGLVKKAFTRMVFTNEIDKKDLQDMLKIQNESGMIKERDNLNNIILETDK